MRSVARTFVCLLAILMPAPAMAQSLPRSILFIDEDIHVHPWLQEFIGTIATTFRSEAGDGFNERNGDVATGCEHHDAVQRKGG